MAHLHGLEKNLIGVEDVSFNVLVVQKTKSWIRNLTNLQRIVSTPYIPFEPLLDEGVGIGICYVKFGSGKIGQLHNKIKL